VTAKTLRGTFYKSCRQPDGSEDQFGSHGLASLLAWRAKPTPRRGVLLLIVIQAFSGPVLLMLYRSFSIARRLASASKPCMIRATMWLPTPVGSR